MSFPRSRPLRYTLITFAVVLVLCALLIGAFQVAVTYVPQYRNQLQGWLSTRTGLAIEFKGIGARLRTYGPELVFDDAIVRTSDRTRVLATARRGSVAFDLWASIAGRRLTAGRFTLDSPQIDLIRTRQGRIQILGQSTLPDSEVKTIELDSLPVGEFRVRNAEIGFRDAVTGRGPWSFSGISFILEREPALLQLRGDASLPRALGESLKFSARVSGALDEVESLVSEFHVEGHGLDLAGWADVMPDRWSAPETGHGSVELSSTFKGTHPASVAARIDLTKISAVAPEWVTPLPVAAPLIAKQDDDVATPVLIEPSVVATDQPAPNDATARLFTLDRIAFALQAESNDHGWNAVISNLDLSRKESPWKSRSIQIQWSSSPETGAFSADVAADRLVLDNLWPLLAWLPESESLARVRALEAQGTVDDLALNLSRAATDQPIACTVEAEVHDAGFKPVLNAPGLAGLSGHVQGTNERGEVRIDSKDVAFTLPHVFRWPLNARTVQGSLRWEHSEAGWRIGSDQLQLATDDGNADAKFALEVPADGSSPLMDLTAQASDLNAAATPKYLPANKLTPKSLAWLDAAFPSGHVDKAELRLHGPLRAFPFRRGEGEFVVRGAVEDTKFNYQEGWAPAEDVFATVEFRNQGMRVVNGTATVHGMKVSRVSGNFADFHRGNLSISAQAAGDLGDALQFLQTSPVSGALGEQFMALQGTGATTADVDLYLPLRQMARRHIEVTTRLSGATVTSSQVDAPVTGLSGSLHVTNSLPDAAQLTGQLLGGPLNLTIEPVAAATPMARLKADGRVTAARLAPVLHLPATVKTSGVLDWRLTNDLETAPEGMQTPRQPRKFIIESDLDGFGIALPYPVGKEESGRRSLLVTLDYDGDATLLTRAALGDVRAVIRLRQQHNGWQLDRGGVRADAVAAVLPPHPGFSIDGALDRLNLDDWFALRGASSGSTFALTDYLKAANLQIGALQVFGYGFTDVRGVLRTVNATWQVSVAGPGAQGELSVPANFAGADPLTMDMDRLVITPPEKTPAEDADEAVGHNDPRGWPAMHIVVRNLQYEDHPLGAVSLQASRVSNGLRFDSITLDQSAMHGEGQAQWLVTPDGQFTQMTASVVSTDFSATLAALNYPVFMEAKKAEVTLDTRWPGGFEGYVPARASGKVTVLAENGQLLTVQPGAGRVLGLFSIAALPRRLSLDFSDLTDKGLSFDAIHGDFDLRDGNAYTNNVLLRGPAAEIGIAGRVGFGARDYDQTAIVTGNLGASLPVAGVLAGGPAVGAALLLFSQVFKEPLKGITRGYYRITGPWDNPVIERVDSSQIKEAGSGTKDGA